MADSGISRASQITHNVKVVENTGPITYYRSYSTGNQAYTCIWFCTCVLQHVHHAYEFLFAGRKTKAGNSKSRSTANEASSEAANADEQQVHEALLVNYSAVRTWTVRAQPLQTADVLVIPVNEDNSHWVTIVICIPRKEIVLLDRYSISVLVLLDSCSSAKCFVL